jgi:hypothetical protein
LGGDRQTNPLAPAMDGLYLSNILDQAGEHKKELSAVSNPPSVNIKFLAGSQLLIFEFI